MVRTEVHRITSGTGFRLADHDPRSTKAFDGDKAAALEHQARCTARLEALQEAMYAEGRQRLLVVLQAMDAGGKDGTIRSVFDGVNPQGVTVKCFKKPTEAELAHDFLWRVHPHAPGQGEIAIWNRSHYEDVLVVRVHNLVTKPVWHRRYHHIAAFEQLLVEEGTVVLKFFLHISKDEQQQRLQERIDNPAKRWKWNDGDLAERQHWDDYQSAYEDAIAATSTKTAPWYVVPADRNWYRNLIVSQVLVETLEAMKIGMPEVDPKIASIRVE